MYVDSMDTNVDFIFFMISFISLVVYFLPTLIAVIRKHNSAIAIFVLNFLLGWSFIAWVIALVWAFSENNSCDLEAKLKTLYSLKEKGLISDEEFERKKEELINSIFE